MPTVEPGSAQADKIDYRREVVASLRLTGLSERAIVEALPKAGVLNEKGKPYTRTPIHQDLQFLKAQWRKNAERECAEAQAEQLATLQEVSRRAFSDSDIAAKDRLELVLKTHTLVAKLVGLNAPDRQEVSGAGGAAIDIAILETSRSKLAAVLTRLIDSGQVKVGERVKDIVKDAGDHDNGNGKH